MRTKNNLKTRAAIVRLCILTFGIMLISCQPQSIMQVVKNDEGLSIVYDKVERLTGLNNSLDKGNSIIDVKVEGSFAIINLAPKGELEIDPKEQIGTYFNEIPDFSQGVTLWRYKPWNSWTKPILVKNPSEMEEWDVQFFYWEYADGLFGACLPLNGEGYRTTLGQYDGKFGAKSCSYGPGASKEKVPQMIVGFGENPLSLFKELYEVGLKEMNKTENLLENKKYPEQLDYIGWCTWNASENGRNLNEEQVISGVKSFTDNNFPLGWVIIDDGWFNQKGRRLNSIIPTPTKFPNGFKSMNERLRSECGVKEIGIWHAFNGYWNGINPDSELGMRYKEEMFSWRQKRSPLEPDTAKLVTYYFIKPESDSLLAFYRNMHQMFREQGFTFLKVDNQLVTERMAVDNYPIFTLSEKMHEALYQSADEYFNGAVINCMDMTAEAYLNFGSSAVARAVEDYFPPDHGGVGYNMTKGNAAAHLVMAMYNSLYFQQMVFPDLDMFETHSPDGDFHAIARAINNGPVYVTDKPGKQDFEILKALCYSDGKLIRASQAITPTRDCLFQIQESKPFKAFSFVGNVGLLGIWNLADAESVSGSFSAKDVKGIIGNEFFVYEYFSGEFKKVEKEDNIEIQLPRMGRRLYYIIPATENSSAIGLIDKYNAPGTILSQENSANGLETVVADGGKFAAVVPSEPKEVLLDEKVVEYEYKDGLVFLGIPISKHRKEHTVKIEW